MPHSACAVSIEVDGRQRYVFETDRLREMLGASRLIADSAAEAIRQFRDDLQLYLMQPASGDLRAWALIERRTALLDAAWAMREWLDERGIAHTCAYLECDRRHFETIRPTPPAAEAPATDEPADASLAWVHRTLSHRNSLARQSRRVADARPTCALFANCLIHPDDAANIWRRDDQEPRRRLISARASLKREGWDTQKAAFYREYLQRPIWSRVKSLLGEQAVVERPIVFSDLTDEGDDKSDGSYMALLCADGDGMGRLISSVDWNSDKWPAGPHEPWRRNRDFSAALDVLASRAFADAVVSVVIDQNLAKVIAGEHEPRVKLPLLLLLLGGDDLWAIAKKEIALPLVLAIAKRYQELLDDVTVGELTALRSAGATAAASATGAPGSLTLSFGVAFAKDSYPAHAMVAGAEALLAQAKKLRKGVWPGRAAPAEGCVDWHWLQSSLTESPEQARERGWQYVDGSRMLRLTTGPWSATQATAFLDASRMFVADVPRRKREQLEGILRRGFVPSKFAWEAWWKSLTAEQQEAASAVRGRLEEAGWAMPVIPAGDALPWTPWILDGKDSKNRDRWVTPMLDLLTLSDTLQSREKDAVDAKH